jgi:hypothetical protein
MGDMEDRLTYGRLTWSRLTCAAITNGCPSSLVFEVAPKIDIDHLDREVPEDRRADDCLRANGWHLDHGRWVCGLHESPPGPLDLLQRRPDIPVHVPLRNDGVLLYDMVLPTWPDDVAWWTPLRNRIPRASKCYRLASGAMVHVKPDCRC